MSTISPAEVKKIAASSHIALASQNIESLTQELGTILNYAERVADAPVEIKSERFVKNINLFREDVAHHKSTELIMQQAPHVEGSYFVVPIILENS